MKNSGWCETHKGQRSFIVCWTWTQLRLNGKSIRCVCWPLSPQWPLGATRSTLLWDHPAVHRGPPPGQSRRHSSCARACSALPGPADRTCSLSRESWRLAVSTTSSRCTATQSRRSNGLLKSTMRLEKGPLRGSSQDLRRTARSRPHSAQASRALDTRRARDIDGPASRGTHCSQTENFGCDSRCSYSWTAPETTHGDPTLALLLKQPPLPTLKPWTVTRKPRPSCTFFFKKRNRPGSGRGHGSKQFRDTSVPPSPMTRTAQPFKMMMIIQNSLLLLPGKADSVDRSSKGSTVV